MTGSHARSTQSLLLALGLAGGIALAAPAAPLRICDGHEPPPGLNPMTLVAWKPEAIMTHLYDGLLAFDPEGRLTSGLATRWEWRDPLRLRLTLRRGVRFHDGRPLDASVVKWNFDTLKDLGARSPRNFLYQRLDHVEVVDEFTVDMVLKARDSALLHKLSDSTKILPPTEPGTPAWERLRREPIGTGPYRFERWNPDGSLRLAPSPDHFRGPPAFAEGLEWHFLPPGEQLEKLFTGEVDLLGDVDPRYHVELRRRPGIALRKEDSLLQVFLGLNALSGPARDGRVRQAVALGLDHASLVRYVARGNGRPVRGVSLPGEYGYPGIPPGDDFDPVEARRLVREVTGGGRIRLRCFTDKAFLLLARAVALQLARVGIDLEVLPVTKAEIVGALLGPRAEGRVPDALDALIDASPDPIYHCALTPAIALVRTGPFTLYWDDRIEHAFEVMATARDEAGVREGCRRLDDLVVELRPQISLYQVRKGYAFRSWVDFRPVRSGLLDLRHSRPAR